MRHHPARSGVIIAIGIIVGAYLGGWLLLVGGIIQGVTALQASPINGTDLAYGIVRVVLCEVGFGLPIAAAAGLAAVTD
ncbi:MAG: hypothetical protein ACR2MN_14595 [Acidimicrobiales bacterium]